MTVIERTAYPRFKPQPNAKELAELYTPTESEIKFVKSRVRSPEGLLCFMVMFKSFQRLGYFPHPEYVPEIIIRHLRSYLKLRESVKTIPTDRQRRNYQQVILTYLEVKAYDKKAQKLIAIVVASGTLRLDHPADLINIAIEELVKERYELPSFNALDRLVCHVRSVTNNRLFLKVSKSLSSVEQAYLDSLLLGETPESTATLNLLKSPPKNAKLKYIKQLIQKFNHLMTFGDAKRLLSGLALSKIKHFATLARALDIAEFQDIKLPKRRTLLLCLLYNSQVKTRDNLVEMYLKRILKIHNNAKERLRVLRERYLAQTEELLGTFGEVLIVSDENKNEIKIDFAAFGHQVWEILKQHGGSELLLQKYLEVAAYNTNNHLPLIWNYYKAHRPVLFDLVRSLDIQSTSADDTVMSALKFVLDCEDKRKRSKYLPFEIDLNFISNDWRKEVVREVDGEQVLVRQQLEICIFSYLAKELNTGDACVVGSESYADFREQLLSEQECSQELDDYCKQLGFPSNSSDFVEYLCNELTSVANSVDKLLSDGILLLLIKMVSLYSKKLHPWINQKGLKN